MKLSEMKAAIAEEEKVEGFVIPCSYPSYLQIEMGDELILDNIETLTFCSVNDTDDLQFVIDVIGEYDKYEGSDINITDVILNFIQREQ